TMSTTRGLRRMCESCKGTQRTFCEASLPSVVVRAGRKRKAHSSSSSSTPIRKVTVGTFAKCSRLASPAPSSLSITWSAVAKSQTQKMPRLIRGLRLVGRSLNGLGNIRMWRQRWCRLFRTRATTAISLLELS
ncbi:hypothetical protein MMC06_006634, partial [Schaereria dolodes]|nr:hypothetical protein [Schaereria dolodes]